MMGKYSKLRQKILSGTADANIGFNDLRHLLLRLNFQERIKGSHHIFFRDDIEEILNLQPRGTQAKPYQVKQVRSVIIKYRMGDTYVD